MPGRDFHAVLIEPPQEPVHRFYITSNQFFYKVGHTTRPAKRPTELNAQIPGHVMGVILKCDCPLTKGRDGRPHCKYENFWAKNYARDRIKRSEQYRRSPATDGQAFFFAVMQGNELAGPSAASGRAWHSWVTSIEVRRRPA